MIGKAVSHYKIIEKLGHGGMGVVYKAEDTKLKRTVALKFLPPELTLDSRAKQRFIHEAQAASALQHNNICTIHEIDETADGCVFIAMDCYEGETLKEKIARGTLPVDEALDIAAQAAAGLSKAHDAGMVHRDIKPANIMVTPDGVVKILDFGLAKLAGRTKVTRTGTTIGTAAYMSPEQAKGEEVDQRTDIWSLGAVLYEMLTGQPPFKGEHEAALLYGIVHEEPEALTSSRGDLPEGMQGIIERALTKDIDERYQSAAAMLSDLIKFQHDKGYTPPAKGARKKTGRYGRFVVRAIFAIIFIVAVIGYRYLRPRKAEQPSGRKMIAILPFENLGSSEDEYFAEGVTEEITSRLSMVRGLGVISRTSTRQYAKTEKSIGQIGEELGVDYVLEGTVRWTRTPNGMDRVRITPQLIQVSDDTHLWAEPYDHVINDIFAVQSEIAQDVAEALGVTLFEHERDSASVPPTGNLEAYHAFLRGWYYSTRPHFTLENWNLMIQNYERAVELDTDFALAYAELARAHARLYYFRHDLSKERQEMARRAAERAIELEPVSPKIHIALSYYYLWMDRDAAGAMEELELAEKKLHENVDILKAKGYIYQLQGLMEDSQRAFERAFELSPRDAGIPVELIFLFWLMRRYPQAINAANQAIALAPDAFWPYVCKTYVYFSWKGGSKEGRTALEAVSKEHPWATYSWFWQEMFEGNYRRAIESLEFSSGDWIMIKMWARPKPLFAAIAHEVLGEQQKARELYETARLMLEPQVERWPEDPRLHGSLGIAYAALGRKKEAIREGKHAVELLPVSKDAFYGIPYEMDLAFIYTIVGEHGAALDQIEHLLSIPSWISPAWLRSDPRWNRLRDHPRFQKLTGRDLLP